MEIFLQKIGIALNYTQELLIVALILARTMPMVVITPFLAGKIAPNEVKMGLGVMLTILLWPMARQAVVVPVPTTAVPFLTLMMKEVFVGLAIGFVNMHVFNVLDMAGRLIDTARGSSMSEVHDPHSQQRVTPLGDMYSQLFLVIFVAIGGHHVFIESFCYSFGALPVTESFPVGPQLGQLMDLMIRMTAELLVIAVGLAAPAVAATLITDVVFGLLNRVAPQLNAYFLAMPVKAMGGLAMVLVAMQALMSRYHDLTIWTLSKASEVMALFATNPGWKPPW